MSHLEKLIADCHPEIHHSFGGDHALGGVRHGREPVRRWFDRLDRLFPDVRLGTDAMRGGRTTHGVHVVRLTWGRAVRIDADGDSQAVAEHLDALAASGVAEVSAAPIVS